MEIHHRRCSVIKVALKRGGGIFFIYRCDQRGVFSVRAANGFMERQRGEDAGEAEDAEAARPPAGFEKVKILFVPSFQVSSTVNK